MDNIYFALKPAPDAAAILLEKIDSWSTLINTTGYLDKLKASWRAYFGAYYSDASNGHQVSFGGEQGELTQFPVNHYANLASHIITMTTSTRPAMDARAMNNDSKSKAQAKLANGILDYYLREKNLEQYLKQAVEHAVIMGAGFVSAGWNATAGEIYDYMLNEDGTEDESRPIYEGDIEFRNHSPFDVVMDGTKENQNHDWYIIRSWRNKYDLAAKYTDFADKLLQLQTKSDIDRYTFGIKTLANEETDDVPVYEFYHKKTDAVPNGRYMLFCEEEIVLQDIGLPYRVLPVFRIAYREFLGTPYGYTSMFDCLPLQEQLNALYSAVATNQNTSAVQNFWTKPNSGIVVSQLSGAMNLIESMDKPEVLQLCATPKEVFDFINIIKQDMETITGVNSVARGDPQASLRTGAALALVQSQALQFISGLQESYVELIENVGTSIIRILQDYAKTPRLISIVGKSNKTLLKQFQGDDISNICRVYVDVGNPLAKTIAGRMELAQNMMQYGGLSDPRQIYQVMSTGVIDDMDDDVLGTLNLITSENEALMDGQNVQALMTDQHKEHIDNHVKCLNDPELRKDQGLVERVTTHIQQHIQLLQTTNPELLQLLGQQPLPPPAPPQPPGQPQGPPPPGPPGGPPPGAHPMGPPQNGPMAQPPGGQQGPSVQQNHLQGPGLPPHGQRIPHPPVAPPNLVAPRPPQG